ncbi:uncharacterized protein LOC134561181 isoform X2 [Prinia subflava]|uniref:uncharacterized protein LOC134561181 isoform X2 n=1 Tax=Prinia subflava TaxID=208062 RepID=UPI002FE3F6C9
MLQTVCLSPVSQNMSESEVCGYSPGQGSPLPGETASPKSCFQQSPSLPDSGLTELNLSSPEIHPPPPPCKPPGTPAPADSELSSDPPQKRYMGVRVKMPVRELLRKIRLSKGLEPSKEASAVKTVTKGSSGKTEKRRAHPYTEKQLRQGKQSAGQSPKGLEDLDILVEVLQEDLKESQRREEPAPGGSWQGIAADPRRKGWGGAGAAGGWHQAQAEISPRGEQGSSRRCSPGMISRTGEKGSSWWGQDALLSPLEGFRRNSSSQEGFSRNSPSQDGFSRNSPSLDGYLRHSSSQDGFLRNSSSQDGFPRNSPSRDGFPRNSSSQDGFLRNSSSQEGFLRNSSSQEGFLRNYSSQDGFSRNSSSQDSFLRISTSQEGFPRNSPSQDGYLRNSSSQDSFSRNSPAQEGFPRNSPSQDGFSRNSSSQDGFLRNSLSLDGFSRNSPSQEGFPRNSPSLDGFSRISPSQDSPALPSPAQMLLGAPRGSPDVQGRLRLSPVPFPQQDLSALSFFQFQLHREENLLRNIPEEKLLAPDENGNRLLHKAVAQGRRALTFALAQRFASLNKIDEKDAEKRTALHLAAEKNQHLIMGDLISLGANVNEQDGSGRTALHLCAENGYLRVLQVLKNCKSSGVCVEVDLPDHCGLTPLHCAALAHTVLVAESQSTARDSSTGRFLSLRKEQILEGILCLLQMGAKPQLQVLNSCHTSTKLEENTELMWFLQAHQPQAQDVLQESCSLLGAPPAAENLPELCSSPSSELLDVLLRGKC